MAASTSTWGAPPSSPRGLTLTLTLTLTLALALVLTLALALTLTRCAGLLSDGLVGLRSGGGAEIAQLEEEAVRLRSGEALPADLLVYATGGPHPGPRPYPYPCPCPCPYP